MIGILQVASYIYKRYMDDFGVRIDEMKLHKLLYFTQRECLIQKGEPMFDAQFKAWKYGPVMVQIRQHYKNDSRFVRPVFEEWRMESQNIRMLN